ncbi:hypothetical protein Q2V57_09220 [Enterobacter bugandensis]|uniref:hypothetical protein n=1 Tax=Enterobacter bugandensis TaxID=881260 RepID=UPI002666E866|nr:hypothetical protein [Enterobacter bugandensis]MDO2431745.1 hypothetical protein [Enterobacter bugandensis]MDO2444795.1 hypothetical protein [Enterobacter bugandensis]
MANNDIFINTRASRVPLTNFRFYLTPKESLYLKINGFGSDGQHLVLGASVQGIVSINQSSRSKQVEQRIQITAIKEGITSIHARESTAKSSKYMNSCIPVNGHFSGCFPDLTIEVISTISMPKNLTSEQKAMLLVLLAEAKRPSGTGYNENDAVKSMQYMKQALYNRFKFSHPYLLDVPKNNPTLIGLIKSGRVIEGFGNYPILKPSVQNNIDAFFDECNKGNSKNFIKYRKLLQAAIEIALGENSGVTSGELVYSWRTQGSSSPGKNFKHLFDLSGQSFYGLQKKFIDNPNNPK